MICLVTVYLLPHRSDYIKSVDNSSGALSKNGSWTGVLGMMKRGEVQVADIPLVTTPERESVVDFTSPLANIKYMSLSTKLLKLLIFPSVLLCFVDGASLYDLLNKANLVHNFSYYVHCFSLHVSGDYVPIIKRNIPPSIPDSHPYSITITKCRINTVVSLHDGHIVARNMYRKETNILTKHFYRCTVHSVVYLNTHTNKYTYMYSI